MLEGRHVVLSGEKVRIDADITTPEMADDSTHTPTLLFPSCILMWVPEFQLDAPFTASDCCYLPFPH